MRGHGSLVVKISDRGWRVMSSSRVPLKTHRAGKQCTLNLSRAQMSSPWCCVVVRRGGLTAQGRPCHLIMVQNCEVRRSKCPRVAEQCAVNIHSPIKMITTIFKSYSLIMLSVTGVRFVIDCDLEMI
ncbi:hypothetical protein TNCV_632181 [Trichonephila clavipes]|nr:hypothetical protein TNCV_632181 [Trichonephila clavipes]